MKEVYMACLCSPEGDYIEYIVLNKQQWKAYTNTKKDEEQAVNYIKGLRDNNKAHCFDTLASFVNWAKENNIFIMNEGSTLDI